MRTLGEIQEECSNNATQKDKLDLLDEAAMQEQKDITECNQHVERAVKDFISSIT
jgi:hypothetical protein